MRINAIGMSQRSLVRGTALALVGILAAGCSSDVSRFQDSIFTGSTRNKQPEAVAPLDQPYPGDTGLRPASVDGTYTGSVNRSAVQPATYGGSALSQPMPRPVPSADVGAPHGVHAAQTTYPAAPVYTAPAYPAAPVQTATLPPPQHVDRTLTGTTPRVTGRQELPDAARPENQPMPQVERTAPATTAEAPRQVGWGASGGTRITVRSGETVYNLARRYGVPVKAILQANNLKDGSSLQAGSEILIPAYSYGKDAPVSAPDNNPRVADAKSSRGTRFDVPENRTPVPSRAPTERVAVLPQTPRLKEKEATPQTAPQNAQRTAAPAPAGEYVVVAGDTLYGIAKKTGTTANAIKEANGLDNGLIRIGQKLRLPNGSGAVRTASAEVPKNVDPVITGGTGHKTKAGDEKVASYTPPRKTETAIEKAAGEKAGDAPNATGIGKMRWPVLGRVISPYGGNSGGKANDGIDIAVPEGTPVKSAENGVVIYAGDGLKEFGNTVLVRHEDGLVTVYGHAGEIKVARGDKVRRGQEIARSGMSGNADTPKLHFEVRKDSAPVDPAKFLE